MTDIKISSLKLGASLRKSVKTEHQGHWRVDKFLKINGVTNALIVRIAMPDQKDIVTEDCLNGGPIKWEVIDNPN